MYPNRAPAWSQLGAAETESGNTAEARAADDRAFEVDPACSMALIRLGNRCLKQGKVEEAQRVLAQAIDIDPDGIGARFHLA